MSNSDKIAFRDYPHYPQELKDAWEYRDRYKDLNDVIFAAMAKADLMVMPLLRLAQWEQEHTDLLE